MSGQGKGVAHSQRADPAASRIDRTLAWGQRLNHLSRSERKSLLLALLVSLLAHGLMLGLSFGGQEFGLPGFELPWRERRVAAPDLHVVLAPAPPPAPSPMATPAEPPPPQAGLESPEPVLDRPRFEPPALPEVAVEEPAIAPPEPEPAGDAAVPEPADAKPERSLGNFSDIPTAQRLHPPLMAVKEPGLARWAAPPVPEVPTRAIATAPSAASSPKAAPPAAPVAAAVAPPKPASAPAEALAQERMRLEQEALAARQRAEQLEAARQEQERQEAQRVQAARLAAERAEAARQDRLRQEAAQLELARQEAARIEAERQEAARQQAARQEQERQEAQRQEAARIEAQRQEAARQQAARLEAERKEQAQQRAAQEAAARQRAAQIEAEEARREAARRAIGRQLDEEAARRDAAAARSPGSLPSAASSQRRGRLLGRADPNAELVLYAEAWARKIQLNVGIEALRELLGRPHANPIVTVALRRDGTVESIVFVVSSGLAELDEAIRRIVQAQAPFQAFSPGLAGDYDVIEIRRTWYFDSAIRLY